MKYLIAFFAFLIIEIAIAYFHFHPFVRYFVGDVLVIPLIFCFFRALTSFSSERIAVAVLLFAFVIETLQYFNFADVLGIDSRILRIIIGTTFSFTDLLAYVIGYCIVVFSEKKFSIK